MNNDCMNNRKIFRPRTLTPSASFPLLPPSFQFLIRFLLLAAVLITVGVTPALAGKKTVFGWVTFQDTKWPAPYSGGTIPADSLPWDVLTHVGLFAANGAAPPQSYYVNQYGAFTARAHQSGVFAGITTGGSSDGSLVSMIADPSTWDNWIRTYLGYLDAHRMDFIEFDFEGSYSASNVSSFFARLYDSLQTRWSGNDPATRPFIILTVSTPRAVSWATVTKPYVGMVNLMCYDYAQEGTWGRLVFDNAPKSYQYWNATGTNTDYFDGQGTNSPAPSMQQMAKRLLAAGWPAEKINVGFDLNPTYFYGGNAGGRGPLYVRQPEGSAGFLSAGSNPTFAQLWPTIAAIHPDSIHFDQVAQAYWAHTGTSAADDRLWLITALPGRDSMMWATRRVIDSMDIGGVCFWNLGNEVWNTPSVPPGGRGWFYSQIRKHFNYSGSTPPPPPPPGGDTVPPTVGFIRPTGGDSLTGTIVVEASASDNVALNRVQFLLDGANLGTPDYSSPWTISWNTDLHPDGVHTLSAVAYDNAGLSARRDMTVILTSPATQPPDSLPGGGSSTSVVVYGDAIAPPWVNGSWGSTITFQSTEQVCAGVRSIKAVQNAWGAVSLHSGSWSSPVPVAASPDDFLSLSVYPEQNATLRVEFQNDLGEQFGSAMLSGVPAGRWSTFTIPVRDLNPDNRVIHQVTVQNYVSSSVTYHLDEVKFISSTAPTDTTAGDSTGGGGTDTTTVASASLKYDRLFIDFGSVGIGDQKTDSVAIANPNDFPVTLTDLRTTSGRFSATSPGSVIDAKSSRKVYVAFTPDSRTTFSSMVITLTDTAARVDTVRLRGTGARRAKGRYSKGAIAIKPVPEEEAVTDSFTVTNDGDLPLRLVSVTSSKTTVQVSPTSATIEPYDSLKFRVRISTKGRKSIRGHIIIQPATGTPDTIAVDLDMSGAGIPSEYSLLQNYPNPFNPATTIGYTLPVGGRVRLSVFNVIGQEVAVLVDGDQEAGYGEVVFDASFLPSGVYLYKITAGDFSDSRKMLLLR